MGSFNIKGRSKLTGKLIKTVATCLFVLLLILPLGFINAAEQPPPVFLVSLPEEGPRTVDPAWSADEGSDELIFNVYETLLFYDGESVEYLIPLLATSWVKEHIDEIGPGGLHYVLRYTFNVREGVYFHDGEWGPAGYYMLGPDDVEYSFERAMVYDPPVNNRQRFIYDVLTNTSGADELVEIYGIQTAGMIIDYSIESNATYVWFNLVKPVNPEIFLRILIIPTFSILSRDWINEYVIGALGRDDWSGEWGDYTEWFEYHNLPQSPLDHPTPVMCGTGPFKLSLLDYVSQTWEVVKFDDYWGGWPALRPAPPYPSSEPGIPPGGHVDGYRVIWGLEWSARRDMFLSGDADFIDVPRQCINEVAGQPGVRFIRDLCMPWIEELAIFRFNVTDSGNPIQNVLPPDIFDESGIPCNFFNYTHIRRAFAYAINYTGYIRQFYGEWAFNPPTSIPCGVPYFDPNQQGYELDLDKAREEFMQVPEVWNNGFTLTLVYNIGNVRLKWFCEMLNNTIEKLHPQGLFHINIIELDWPTYLDYIARGYLSFFILNWREKYPLDPHFYLYDTMHVLAQTQGYSNPEVDELLEEGMTTQSKIVRTLVYIRLQGIYHSDCISIPLVQPVGYHFERSSVVGWYFNPGYPVKQSYQGIYAYPIWKGTYKKGDVNYDGVVLIDDIAWIAKAFGSDFGCGGATIHPRWNFRCDINEDRIIMIDDIAIAARNFGDP